MVPKYLMFTVGLVAVTTVALAAMEMAVLSQDADAQSSTGQCARALKNASAQLCHRVGTTEEEQDTQADESDDEEEENE